MILQEFSDAQYEAARELHGGDWRKALGSLILAWCDGKDDNEPVITLPRFLFFAFTVRVWHLERIIIAICGDIPPFGRA